MHVTGLTHQALGRLDDGTLQAGVLPGEEVDANGRILRPSANRVSAPCRQAKSCGGCALQHASDAFVADWKQEVLRKALDARGLDAPFQLIETSPPRSRRRAKLSGRRTKSGAMVGFHARGSDQIVSIPDCQILTSAIQSQIQLLETIARLVASRRGEVGLTVLDTEQGLDLRIETDRDLTIDLRSDLAALMGDSAVARLTWNAEPVATIAVPRVRFGSASVTPPPGAFLQATKAGEAALVQGVQDIVEGCSRIVDLFAGCGTFALNLAGQATVHAVEGDAELTEALDAGWRGASGLKAVTTEVRDLFRRPLEPDELQSFDAAVIDPPRAGAEAQVARLSQSEISTVAMVSCNPVTFARDARCLVDAGFTLDWVKVVDQFRWSAHIELVAAFRRA